MAQELWIPSRRLFMSRFGLGAAALYTGAFYARGAFADELMRTPRQTEGPFYPVKLPLDTDNDLIIVNDALTPAVGTITHLSGKVMNASGAPVRNALVEIWQADNHGVYLHAGSENGAQRDNNFQGFGRFLTGSSGEYYFRTIKPVPYPGRTPHIHFKLKLKGKEALTTQCYIKDYPANNRDGVLLEIRDPKALALVLVDFVPIKESKVGEVAARFDIVLGVSPEQK